MVHAAGQRVLWLVGHQLLSINEQIQTIVLQLLGFASIVIVTNNL